MIKSELTKIFLENSNLKIDLNLYKKIKKFRLSWANKNNDYVEFLSSTYTGVYPVRFSNYDMLEFLEDILKIKDIDKLQDDLSDYIGSVLGLKNAKDERKVAVNMFNLSCVITMHLFMHSDLKREIIKDAIKETYLVLGYKMLSGRIAERFKKYDASINVAKEVEERMSYKFLLKKMGSWQATLEHWANLVADEDGLHYRRVYNLNLKNCDKLKDNKEDCTLYIITDIYDRIHNVIKLYYNLYLEVKEENDLIKINDAKHKDEDEGYEVLKVNENSSFRYINNIKDLAYRKRDFIRGDLIIIVSDLMNNDKTDLVKETLLHLSEKFLKEPKEMEELMHDIIEPSIDYLFTKNIRHKYKDNIIKILKILKVVWTNSKIGNPQVKKVKEALRKEIKSFSKIKTEAVISKTVNTIAIYIFVLSLVAD